MELILPLILIAVGSVVAVWTILCYTERGICWLQGCERVGEKL